MPGDLQCPSLDLEAYNEFFEMNYRLTLLEVKKKQAFEPALSKKANSLSAFGPHF